MDFMIIRRICSLCLKPLKISHQNTCRTLAGRIYPVQHNIVRWYASGAPPEGQDVSAKVDKKLERPEIMTEQFDQKRHQGKRSQKNQYVFLSWKGVVLVSLAGGLSVWWLNMRKQKMELAKKQSKTQSLGKPLIGGAWQLTDHTGKTRTDQDFFGKWLLVYFGFTHCPDICPDELDKISRVVDMLEKRGQEVVPLFVSLDPERDTVEKVGEYVKDFSPKFIGLTGDLEKVDKMAKTYRVYYHKSPVDEDGDYLVDHSIITYFINPNGKFEQYYHKGKTDLEVADDIERRIKEAAQ